MLISIVERWALQMEIGETVASDVNSALDQLQFQSQDGDYQTQYDELLRHISQLSTLSDQGINDRDRWNRTRQYVVDACFLLRQSLLEPSVDSTCSGTTDPGVGPID